MLKPYERIGENLYGLRVRNPNQRRATAGISFSRGQHAECEGQREVALALYQESLMHDPTFAPAWVNLGTLYFLSHNLTKARRCYRKAVEMDPDYALAWFNLGGVLDEKGLFKESLECYLKSIALAPSYSEAHYNLALLYEKMKENRLAANHFGLYLHHTADKQDDWSDEARRRIRQLRMKDVRLVPKPPAGTTRNSKGVAILMEG